MAQRFQSRSEAAELLAERLDAYANAPDTIVLALPRGGVPIGYVVATALKLPLDAFNVRKLGVPGHEELAMGAIGSGSACYLNRDVIDALKIGANDIEAVIAKERKEIEHRERLYRGGRPAPNVAGKRVILVDDGIATGSTMFAAIEALRAGGAREIVAAIPVGPVETCGQLENQADRVICLRTPDPFYAVGAWYANFAQVGDDEVRTLLDRRSAGGGSSEKSRPPN
jgi:putative phosphoribosyl transferase